MAARPKARALAMGLPAPSLEDRTVYPVEERAGEDILSRWIAERREKERERRAKERERRAKEDALRRVAELEEMLKSRS